MNNQSKNHAAYKGKTAGRYQFHTHLTVIGLINMSNWQTVSYTILAKKHNHWQESTCLLASSHGFLLALYVGALESNQSKLFKKPIEPKRYSKTKPKFSPNFRHNLKPFWYFLVASLNCILTILRLLSSLVQILLVFFACPRQFTGWCFRIKRI